MLNMISTLSMVGLGKVYSNLMVDLRPTNQKLIQRSIGIIQDICDLSENDAASLYDQAQQQLKVAVVMHLANCSRKEAETRLQANQGQIKRAIQ